MRGKEWERGRKEKVGTREENRNRYSWVGGRECRREKERKRGKES